MYAVGVVESTRSVRRSVSILEQQLLLLDFWMVMILSSSMLLYGPTFCGKSERATGRVICCFWEWWWWCGDVAFLATTMVVAWVWSEATTTIPTEFLLLLLLVAYFLFPETIYDGFSISNHVYLGVIRQSSHHHCDCCCCCCYLQNSFVVG